MLFIKPSQTYKNLITGVPFSSFFWSIPARRQGIDSLKVVLDQPRKCFVDGGCIWISIQYFSVFPNWVFHFETGNIESRQTCWFIRAGSFCRPNASWACGQRDRVVLVHVACRDGSRWFSWRMTGKHIQTLLWPMCLCSWQFRWYQQLPLLPMRRKMKERGHQPPSRPGSEWGKPGKL